MIMWIIGVAFFAVCIMVSVALHECRTMWSGRAARMKVRRSFVGFGPTLWSTRRPNRLGYTEYGLKAVPLGGFCDIAGMTAIDEIAPEDQRYAMYRQKTWKRVLVLFAGPAMNFVIGLVLIYAMAMFWGLPNLHPQPSAYVSETSCVAPEVSKGQMGKCEGTGRAAAAGITAGDIIVKVGDTDVHNPDEMVAAVRALTGPTQFVIKRTQGAPTAQISTLVDLTTTPPWTP